MNIQQVDESLLQDLARRLRTDDLLRWIEVRTTELARIGWKKSGYVNLGPRLLAELGIAECIVDLKLSNLARLSPKENGSYVIRHHGFSKEEDRRFWIAHEAAHTFWLLQGDSLRPLSPRQRAIGNDPTIEWLCNRAAAAILVPKGLLEMLLREDGYGLFEDPPPIHLLETLARKLRVTPRLLARRWFHDILNIERNVVCISASSKERLPSQEANESCKIVWEAIFSKSAKLPRKLQGRLIPPEALPPTPQLKTEHCQIDARWLSLISQARGIKKVSTPFYQLPCQGNIDGLAAMGRTGILLSFLG